MKRLLFIVGYLYIIIGVHAETLISVSDYFVTPEMYGVKSGICEDPVSNADSLQLAVDCAISTGRKLVSRGDKYYYIGKSIHINGALEADWGRATIVATDTINMIEIDYKTQIKWFGCLSGFVLDMNGIAKRGIHCSNAVKMHITDGDIKNISRGGIGLQIDNGYEMVVDNVHFDAVADYATGLKITTSDCHFSDCIMINCKTAIDNYGSNMYDRIHAWIGNKGDWLRGSVFFLSRGGESFLSQCCSDTFEKVFLITTPVNLFISQHKNFHNTKMWKMDPESISAVMFCFSEERAAKNSKIYLNNSSIGGLFLGGKNRQSFSNYDGLGIISSACKINN